MCLGWVAHKSDRAIDVETIFVGKMLFFIQKNLIKMDANATRQKLVREVAANRIKLVKKLADLDEFYYNKMEYILYPYTTYLLCVL